MRRVREVEDLAAELRAQTLGEVERPIDAEVEIARAGTAERVIAGRAEACAGDGGERSRVEVHRRIAEDLDLGLHLIGPLVAAGQAQGVAGGDAEGGSGVHAQETVNLPAACDR